MTGADKAVDALGDAQDAADALIGNGVEARVGRANALAQLAVAAELRALRESQETANLIAYMNTGPHSWAHHPGENVLNAVQGQIEERLGLV